MNVLCLVLLVTLLKISEAVDSTGESGDSTGEVGDSEAEEMEYVDWVIETCKEEVGATDDDVQALIDRNPEVTHEGKCVLDCVGREIGIVMESGKFNLAAAKHILSLLPVNSSEQKVYEEIIDKCGKSPAGDDECEVAYMFVQCLTEESENL